MKMERGGGGGEASAMERGSKYAASSAVEVELEKKGNEEGEGKAVVVGVRMDSQSRELLTWALVKAAASGDRVLALHVLPSSSNAGASAVNEMEAMLAVYEGFCNLKQIDLKLKVCKGSSIRKILVREAKAFAASKLILGVNKNSRGIGYSQISIAKYCAKKLPSSCSVIALSNGKIVFQREITEEGRCQKKCSKASTKGSSGGEDGQLYCLLPIARSKGLDAEKFSPPIRQTHLPNGSSIEDGRCQKKCIKDSTKGASGGGDDELYCLLPIAGSKGLNAENCSPSIRQTQLLNGSSIVGSEDVSSVPDVSPRTSPSTCSSESTLPHLDEPKEEMALALVPVENSDATLSPSASPVLRKMQATRKGWPLLRRLLPNDTKSVSDNAKNSVLPWGILSPSRHSSVHPDHRRTRKSDSDGRISLDREKSAIVPVGDELPPSSFIIHYGRGRLLEELESFIEKYSSVCRLFSYEELIQATSNTSPENLIGKGGSSIVYKGILSDGKELAVKILKPSEDAIQELIKEVEIVSTLHHKNIISVIGFCLESNNLILVYNYLSMGSLEDILHGEVNCSPLSWPKRYKVAIGVAEALDYLHGGGGGESIIHRDVKTSNILLSEDFEPQLSDFGLARRASESSMLLSASDRAGTFGYLAPEFFLYGKVNEKTDVYAFGVVLLELLSGRKPISIDGSKGQESLVMWAKPILQRAQVKNLLDPRLDNECDSNQVESMRLAAFLSIRRLPQARPKMALILRILQGDDEALKWARLEVETPEGVDGLDEEVANQKSSILSHINLAMLDVEDDSLSNCSTSHTIDSLTANASIEDFLQNRWSRSSSFD